MQNNSFRKRIVALTMVSVLAAKSALAAEFSGYRGQMEFLSSNREGRVSIEVHVLGDIALAGVHHVPDNMNLLDLIAYVGGTKGDLADAQVLLRRSNAVENDNTNEVIRCTGDQPLGEDTKKYNVTLQPKDLVYIKSEIAKESFMYSLGIVSTLASLVSTVLVVFFLLKKE